MTSVREENPERRDQPRSCAGLCQDLPELVDKLAFGNTAHSFQGSDGALPRAHGQGHEFGHGRELCKHELLPFGDALFQEKISAPYPAEGAQDRSDHDDGDAHVSSQNEADAEDTADQNTEHREDHLLRSVVDHRLIETRPNESSLKNRRASGEGSYLVGGPRQCLLEDGPDTVVSSCSTGSHDSASVQGGTDLNHAQLRRNAVGKTGRSDGTHGAEHQPQSPGQNQGNDNS